MAKRDRRERIAHVAEARDASGTTPTRRGFLTFWLTRDSVAGTPAELARVWLRRPLRSDYVAPDGRPGKRWYASREADPAAPGSPRPSALYAEWSRQVCEANASAWPDDDRQCVVKEGWGGVGDAPPCGTRTP